uniref:2'-5'-oligoadenylate synthetase 1 domain-containing protein n=1 Tax=Branchiostoma floridae TaxID=7739 RepID=C3YU73_BRAFL|eukprot:XP_002600338.1 hypothetical protein BRAFLDRAFT_66571 [Branchiostoma floridae]
MAIILIATLFLFSRASADIKDFLDSCKPADVHRYISDHLQPDESYRNECSSVVDHLARFFKTGSDFTVNRFIKGGSLGKGTALKSKSDVDVVMFISELPAIRSFNYSDKLRMQLDALESTLQRPWQSIRNAAIGIGFRVAVVGRTNYAVKLRVQSLKPDHKPHDVDLLLTSDLLGPTPSNSKIKDVYEMMATMNFYGYARENCSAALVAFVKKQPAEVKDLIRLVKMWKSSCVREPSLTSYPLELLCIHTWPSCGTVAGAFKAVLEKLSDHKRICAYWTDNYPFDRMLTMLRRHPLILDPANPYNNVADRCRDWDAVARAARETLQKPFFRYV